MRTRRWSTRCGWRRSKVNWIPNQQSISRWHGDATSSFKQNQFGEANVQLTFLEKNRKTIDGVDCAYVEPDID